MGTRLRVRPATRSPRSPGSCPAPRRPHPTTEQLLAPGTAPFRLTPFHEKADRSQDGFVFLSVDPNLFTEPPLSPSFHPQSVMSDDRSLPVGRP